MAERLSPCRTVHVAAGLPASGVAVVPAADLLARIAWSFVFGLPGLPGLVGALARVIWVMLVVVVAWAEWPGTARSAAASRGMMLQASTTHADVVHLRTDASF